MSNTCWFHASKLNLPKTDGDYINLWELGIPRNNTAQNHRFWVTKFRVCFDVLSNSGPDQSASSEVTWFFVLVSMKVSGYSVTYPEIFWADRYIHRNHEGTTGKRPAWKCSNFAPPDAQKMHSLACFKFLYKIFS